MSEPTKEQQRKLWEKCGVVKIKRGWKFPNGDVLIDQDPVIDLNNLFKWAVPIAIKEIMVEQECDKELAFAILFKKWLHKGFDEVALFWVLYEALDLS